MHSTILFKSTFLLYSLFILTSCESSHQRSFEQLESALISWYYKYHPTITTELNITKYNHQIEKYNIESIEEYKADINRFMIELSQIDETRLKSNDLIRYLVIDEFLFQKYNNLLNFESYTYSAEEEIGNLYDSLFFIIHNNDINMDLKAQFCLSRLASFSTSINNIQKKIVYYSENDVKKTLDIINAFEELLNNLYLYINSNNSILDEIENHIFEINKSIKKLKNYLANLDRDNTINLNEKVAAYLTYNKDINFKLDYEFLIQKLNSKMLDIALPIYKINNDEPVWVDRDDTLNIIDFVLKEAIDIYPDRNQIIMNLDKSLNRINLFCDKSSIFKQNNANYEVVINNHNYLKPNTIYRLWSDKNKTYLFLDREHYKKNKLQHKFNKYELDLYNMTNYFPGKYFQKQKTQAKEGLINSIFVNAFTNHGWGLLTQHILLKEGYGGAENNIYMLVHMKNILKSVLKNMIFVNYYINGKTERQIENDIVDLTFYENQEIQLLISESLKDPLESNFEIIGYLKLQEIYDNFDSDKISYFNSILLKSAHLSPKLIKEFKFSND
tara:strand:+ start:5522 stop:7195 length:1674 start_codon:yes stop_codon:yes gene_type:complete